MVILSYILLIIAVAGAGIALVITHTALILGSLLFIFSLFLIETLVKRLNKYKPQNKMFRFYKTFCSRITLINTNQNVILNPI